MGGGRNALLLMDANVLIDFLDSDHSILRLVSAHIGQVHVPWPILAEEVVQASRHDWTELGIVAVEPTLEVATTAATRRAGLSFHDALCLLLAQEHGWTCVTNDRRLRRACKESGVGIIWGLELMAMLVEDEVLPIADAERIGLAIQAANPHFITSAVMARFLQRIRAARPRPPRR